MVLNVKTIGSGVRHDAFRVALPTYDLILMDHDAGTALIKVPDDVHGLSASDLEHESVTNTSEGPHYPNLCDGCVSKIHANLDKRYKEHKGEYALEIVKSEA